MKAYPEAKVVLSMRDVDSWLGSMASSAGVVLGWRWEWLVRYDPALVQLFWEHAKIVMPAFFSMTFRARVRREGRLRGIMSMLEGLYRRRGCWSSECRRGGDRFVVFLGMKYRKGSSRGLMIRGRLCLRMGSYGGWRLERWW